MTNKEKEIILSYLDYAYKKHNELLKIERQTINKDFPILSVDYKVAKAQYNQMIGLTRDLWIKNPYETFTMDIDIIQD